MGRPLHLPDQEEKPLSPAISGACASEGGSSSRPCFPRLPSASSAGLSHRDSFHRRRRWPWAASTAGTYGPGSSLWGHRRQKRILPFEAGNEASETTTNAHLKSTPELPSGALTTATPTLSPNPAQQPKADERGLSPSSTTHQWCHPGQLTLLLPVGQLLCLHPFPMAAVTNATDTVV